MAGELEHVAEDEIEHEMEKSFFHELAAITVDYRRTLVRGGFAKKDATVMTDKFHDRLLKKMFGK